MFEIIKQHFRKRKLKNNREIKKIMKLFAKDYLQAKTNKKRTEIVNQFIKYYV